MPAGFPSTGEVFSVVCAFIWAIAVILFRISGEKAEPVALNLFKNVVGLSLFLLTLPWIGVDTFPAGARTSDIVALAISGVLGIGVADTLFFASLNRLGAGNTALVDALYCPFVIVCAFLYLHEPIGAKVIVAMLLMTVAIVVGTWEPSVPKGQEERRRTLVGVGLGVLGMFLMAVGLVVAKPVLERASPWWVSTVRTFAGAVFLLVQGMLPRHRAGVVAMFRPSRTWRVAIPAAVLGCYVATIFWIAGLKLTLASIASVLNQTSTVFIVLLAVVFLKERLTVRRGVAVAIAFGGAAVASI